MALSQDEADKLRQQIQEIERLSRLLGKNISAINFTNLERDADLIRAAFASLTDEFNDFTGDISYAVTGFKKLVQQITNSNIGVRETSKSLNKLSSIAEKLQSHQKGYSDLTTKDLKKLQEQYKVERQRLSNAQHILRDKKDLLIAEKQQLEIQKQAALTAARRAQANNDTIAYRFQLSEARKVGSAINKINREYTNTTNSINANNALLTDQDILLKGLKTTINKTNEDLEEQRKLLGLGGNSIAGLKNALNSLGFGGLAEQLGIDEANEKMKDLSKRIIEFRDKEKRLAADIIQANQNNLSAEELRAGVGGTILQQKQRELDKLTAINQKYSGLNGQTRILLAGTKSLGSSLLTNLRDPLVLGGFLITNIIKGFFTLNQAQTEFGRETGKTIAHFDTLNGSLISSSDYIKTATTLTKQFGASADAIFTKETLQEATEMVHLMGMSAEDAGKMARFSRLSGTELKANNVAIGKQLESFNRTNRTGISLASTLRDVANTSDDIALSLGGNPTKIANANAEARKLGLSLSQIDKIAGSLLNFEDSISAELEAELLTGKQINLEQARLYALNNDIVGLTKEIGTNQDLINSFAGSNRIQQEAIAKSLGMGREEMAKMIYDQRAINGLSDEQLQKVMGIGSEDLKRLSVQESINKSLEKMGEALAGPLQFMAELVGHTGVMYTILGAIGALLTGKIVTGAIQFGKSLATAIPKLVSILTLESGIAAAKITAAEAATLGLATIGIVAGIAAAMGAFDNATDKATSKAQQLKDGYVSPGGLVVAKPEGGILKPLAQGLPGKDYAYLSTNSPEKLNTPTAINMPPVRNSAQAEFDYDKMAAAMARVNINTSVKVNDKEIANAVNTGNLVGSTKLQ